MNSLNFFKYIPLVFLLVAYTPDVCAQRRKKRLSRQEMSFPIEPDVLAAKPRVEKRMRPAMQISAIQSIQYEPWREGIDVSHYQGFIDWDCVAQCKQISYVYLKATEGNKLVDKQYRRNISEARRVGLRVGSYHFYRPNVPWREQFRHLKEHVKGREQDLLPIIDIERRGRVSEARFIRDLRAFLQQVEKHYGKKPVLYTYQNFYNRYLANCFGDYHWMIAKYQDESPVLTDGTRYTMWQYTESGSLPGIEGPVDRSRLVGDFELQHVVM